MVAIDEEQVRGFLSEVFGVVLAERKQAVIALDCPEGRDAGAPLLQHRMEVPPSERRRRGHRAPRAEASTVLVRPCPPCWRTSRPSSSTRTACTATRRTASLVDVLEAQQSLGAYLLLRELRGTLNASLSSLPLEEQVLTEDLGDTHLSLAVSARPRSGP